MQRRDQSQKEYSEQGHALREHSAQMGHARPPASIIAPSIIPDAAARQAIIEDLLKEYRETWERLAQL